MKNPLKSEIDSDAANDVKKLTIFSFLFADIIFYAHPKIFVTNVHACKHFPSMYIIITITYERKKVKLFSHFRIPVQLFSSNLFILSHKAAFFRHDISICGINWIIQPLKIVNQIQHIFKIKANLIHI